MSKGLLPWRFSVLLACSLAVTVQSKAVANEPGLSAQEVVRRYSRSVACQIALASDGWLQYASLELESGQPESGVGAVWLVGWTGDLGCMGGNGTQGLQMTLVAQNGFSRHAVSPVVIDANPMPDLLMNGLRGLSVHDGVVTIVGTSGRLAVGSITPVTERYRWRGLWVSGPRFERLP